MTPLFRCDVPVGGTMKLLSAIAVLFITVGVCLNPYIMLYATKAVITTPRITNK